MKSAFLLSFQIQLIYALPFDSLTGGSIVGDIAPYQAFAIGGLGSVRGYGEGAVGSGRSFLVANSELTFPLVSHFLVGLVYSNCHPIFLSIILVDHSFLSSAPIDSVGCLCVVL